MTKDKKYYWLKLDRNFFKRHDVRIVEDMPNGKEYVLFFMKLLVESIDHEGRLRFNDFIPYNEQMLGTVTNTNIDIVRSAINIFEQLDLLSIMDDKTIYIHDTQKMLGAETEWAKKKRAYREQKLLVTDIAGTKKDNVRQEIELEKEKELEIELDIEKDKKITQKSKRFVAPTLAQVTEYCNERKNNVDPQRFIDYYESNGWKVGKNKMKDWQASVRTWERTTESKPKTSRAAKVVEQPVYKKEIEPVENIEEYIDYFNEFLKGEK